MPSFLVIIALVAAWQTTAFSEISTIPKTHCAPKNPVGNKPTVTAHMKGQLGNNLFQVATASALAWDNKAQPYFPVFPPQAVLQHVFFRCNILPAYTKISCTYQEPSANYSHIPFAPHMKIDGYFQSEKYFAHYRKRLLKLFAPHPKDLEYMKSKYQWLMNHPNSVGIQIRYYKFEDPQSKIYPQYGKDYLEKAMAHFPASSLFVVSSNNLEYARKNVPIGKRNVIFLEKEPSYIDLHLLSMCKHNIITNSSFGWWAAWLNQNAKKKVLYPKLLFYGIPSQDYCPKEWIGITATPDKS
jgi:hypothetical protein